MIYFAPIFLSVYSFLIAILFNRRLNNIALCMFIIIMVAIIGVGAPSGTDYDNYLGMYFDYPDLSDFLSINLAAYHGEPGYILINSIAKSFNIPFGFLFTFFSLVSLTIKAVYFKRASINPAVVATMYLSFHMITIEFIQIRWAMASALIIYSLVICRSTNLRRTAILLIAASIQSFSLMFLPLLFISDKYSKRLLFNYILVCCSIFALSFFIDVPNGLINILNYLGLENGYLIVKGVYYLSNQDATIGFFSYARILFYLFFFVIFTARSNLNIEFFVAYHNVIIIKLGLILISVCILLTAVPIFFYRTMVIVDLLSLCFIVNVIYTYSKIRLVRIPLLFILISLGVTWYFFDLANNLAAGHLSQYSTWLGAFL